MTIPGARPSQIPVLAPSGELDYATIAPFAKAMEEAATRHPAVIVDLSGVTFGDSVFLNTLLHGHRLTDLRLAGIPKGVARVLEITGLHEAFSLYPSVEAAQNPRTHVSEAV